jgi:undecaprenyl-diphosphatase
MPKPGRGSIVLAAPAGIDRRRAPAQHGRMVAPTSTSDGKGRAGWRAWLAGRMPELGLLLSLLIFAGGLWLFFGIAEEMHEGELARLDRQVLMAFRDPADPTRPLGPAWLEEAMRDLTALGSVAVLTTITLAAALYLVLARKARVALFLLVAIGGGVLIGFALKAGFARPRPDLVPPAVRVFTGSFPSGHSMMSAVTYLTLGALLARIEPRRSLKVYLVGLAVLISLVVGISRIYLGVHWPSDVIAGWALGAAWALLCWSVALWLQVRGRIGSDAEADAMARR